MEFRQLLPQNHAHSSKNGASVRVERRLPWLKAGVIGWRPVRFATHSRATALKKSVAPSMRFEPSTEGLSVMRCLHLVGLAAVIGLAVQAPAFARGGHGGHGHHAHAHGAHSHHAAAHGAHHGARRGRAFAHHRGIHNRHYAGHHAAWAHHYAHHWHNWGGHAGWGYHHGWGYNHGWGWGGGGWNWYGGGVNVVG